MCVGTNVSGHNHVWAQSCLGTIVSGHKRVWAQSCLGTIVSGHKRVWAQTCVGTNVSGHSRVGPIMYGHKRGGTHRNKFHSIKQAIHYLHAFIKIKNNIFSTSLNFLN